jgi:hypothetical protein
MVVLCGVTCPCACAGLLGSSLDGANGLISCEGGCVVSITGGGGGGSVGGVFEIFIGDGWFDTNICGGGGGLILLRLGLSMGGI